MKKNLVNLFQDIRTENSLHWNNKRTVTRKSSREIKKNGKVAGTDNIEAEIMKLVNDDSLRRLRKTLTKYRKQER